MKTLKFLSVALLAMGLCLNFTACSSDDDDSVTIYEDEYEEEVYEPVIVEINVEKAGTLESLVEEADFSYPDVLKISGNLNGDDIVFLRDGSYALNDVLDLSEAQIVEGGVAYYTTDSGTKYYTEAGKIGDYMFVNWRSLGEMILPNNITEIGEYSFGVKRGHTISITAFFYLRKITLPEGLLKIGYKAFGCSSNMYCLSYLEEINIPNSVTEIGDDTFYYCEHLRSITLPESITEVPSGMFNHCTSLADVNLPEGITEIGVNAFYYCESLTEITIPYALTSIGYSAFENCSSLTEITIPDAVTSIDSYAFENCSSLTEITIPDAVTSIDSYAFENCSNLYTLTIGSSVESIGKEAFNGCDKLEYIYCYATTPPELGSSVFSKTNTFVYVPKGTLEEYQNAWSYFSNIYEME